MTHLLDTTTAQFFAHLHGGGNYSYYWQLAGKRSTWWNGTGAPTLPFGRVIWSGSLRCPDGTRIGGIPPDPLPPRARS